MPQMPQMPQWKIKEPQNMCGNGRARKANLFSADAARGRGRCSENILNMTRGASEAPMPQMPQMPQGKIKERSCKCAGCQWGKLPIRYDMPQMPQMPQGKIKELSCKCAGCQWGQVTRHDPTCHKCHRCHKGKSKNFLASVRDVNGTSHHDPICHKCHRCHKGKSK